MNKNFEDFFKASTGNKPFPWQNDLGAKQTLSNRLIQIPTGFGKTLGVLTAWVYNRVARQNDAWPRRLVWCLPMRTLVEQTTDVAQKLLEKMGLIWTPTGEHIGKVGVHTLMGGADAGDWHLFPEECAVLVGTQDMLLSRALNRGYAAPRARWPMEFGLLNHDCLWVMDEVQLMDVGLATSTQLQAFREQAVSKAARPSNTWWMSATLRQEWLSKSPDTQNIAAQAKTATVAVAPNHRTGPLWDGITKCLRVEPAKDIKAVANMALQAHKNIPKDSPRFTLIVMNTVERALEVAAELKNLKESPDTRVIHSRFRPHERKGWSSFLNRQACESVTDRILVATQVVEAGVDISAGALITELAPWSSLIQRFGRAARWGGKADVIVADLGLTEKNAAPYAHDDLKAARQALDKLTDAGPLSLDRFEKDNPHLLQSLYPYDPKHLLLRHELDQLFDTTPDLSGADVDISRFIRSGAERDCFVFWDHIPQKEKPSDAIHPAREALCAVPFHKVQEWLCGAKSEKLLSEKRAWVWDWLSGKWREAKRRDMWPGQTVLVAAACGGYNPERGWDPKFPGPVPAITPPPLPETSADAAQDSADAAQDNESLSEKPWCTIATHGHAVACKARDIANQLAPELAPLLDIAGRWHDVGKAHPAFQACIKTDAATNDLAKGGAVRNDWAKAPDNAWHKGSSLYRISTNDHRPGFRHELAGALALFDVLRRHNPKHPALLGPWMEFLEQAGMAPELASTASAPPTPIEQEILKLDAEGFNLLAYLICSHHGKVRMSLHACPADQDAADGRLRIRGISNGDTLPEVLLIYAEDRTCLLPKTNLDLSPSAMGLSPRTGQGWTERALALQSAQGSFRLAWLEACLRAADIRASRESLQDPLLAPAPSVGAAKQNQHPGVFS